MSEEEREFRVEDIYQSWGAREMAERIVELEEKLELLGGDGE